MNWKSLLRVSASPMVLLAAMAPSAARAQAANPPQEAPKPDAATDQSINPAAPAPASQANVADANGEIVVTGLRRSLQSAQAIKRTSDGIVDAVVAEDIGKLPDTFASSALQRIPGVGVTRGGGESAGVTVRGLPDLTTTYNGRQIFTAEGRYVQIQDFPAGTVAALEVYKSGTANQIEGGIAGEVNVRGRRPFDFRGFEVSGSLNGVYWDQSDKKSWNGNLLVSDRWTTGIGEMGLLLNVSYVGINFLDSTREQSLVIATTDANNAPTAQRGLRFPDAQGNFLGYGDRYRPSANAAFQWKPTPELEIYADGLYQGFRSKDYNRWLFVPIFGGITLSDVTTIPGTNQVSTATVSGAVRPEGYTGSFNGKTDTYQAGGGAVWTRDRLKISADIAYTDSQYTANLVNVDYAAARSPVRKVAFDVSDDGGPSQTFVDFDLKDPANFISRGLYQELLIVNGKDWQSRADLTYDFGTGFLKRLDFGVRYDDRDAGRDFGNFYVNNEGAGIPLTTLPGAVVKATLPGFDFNNAQPNRTYAALTRNSIRNNLVALRSFFGTPAGLPAFNPTDNFRANEKSYAGYAQLKYGFDLGDTVIDGLVGLRAVKTKTRISGFSRIDAGGGVITNPAITARNEYTDYLPNVSARVAFTDKLQLRLAYTQTRTRPSFFDLRPNLTLGQPVILAPGDPCLVNATTADCVERLRRGGSAGNPDLRPLTSDNYDVSLEYYFSRTGSVTAAIFRHNADGFVATNPDRSAPGLRIDRPYNLGKTRLQGAEMSFVSFLDLDGLPEWAKGFGIQANGTYIQSKEDLNPGSRPFNGVSKWAYNVIALYERPSFSARLAYNYRSKFVTAYTFEALDPFNHGITERGRGQLDGSVTVTPVPNITVAFDVVNLLGNPLRRYRPYDTGDIYARQIIYLERTYSLGIRFRF
ncbi:TonB-dependent receptor [Sphingomonas crusticola]|uniref:TonB-dependent receptor n=1 Tax=Sphingomonas crusticola TaxID=1697973 RepID=UPI000E241F64|nr:TonB-dependent receptor [Sphingomonas crusticola]